MPTVQEITAAITNRLSEAHEQIASLEAARSALTATAQPRGRGRTGPRRADEPKSRTTPTRPRKASSRSSEAPTSEPEPPTAQPAVETIRAAAPTKPARRRRSRELAVSQAESGAAQPAAKPAPAATKPTPRRRSRSLAPGQLEELLRESEDGLSRIALAIRTGVSEAKVRDRLRELERSGEARSLGSRRTSLWRLVSDEERIAERVAELARASGTQAPGAD